MRTYRHLLSLASLALAGISLANTGPGSVAKAAGEAPKDVLAAQVRTQGVTCDNPQRAVRDTKRSKPDYEVWILTCQNATYRVSRYPDLAAKIVRLR